MRRWWLLLILVPALLGLGFAAWALSGPRAMPEARAALDSDMLVEVDAEKWLVFRPVDQDPTSGLILYPGGRVDPSAYAPIARDIAADGHLVIIVPMPLNLAFLAPARAAEVVDMFPDISSWAIGGHSLGGAMAANFADKQPSAIQGLVLWGAYPAQSDDLSDQDLIVTSIYGTNDGLASLDEIRGSKALLPSDARWVAIEGGNHAQFGWYGPQSGDNPAEISRESQQAQLVQATLELLRSLADEGDS